MDDTNILINKNVEKNGLNNYLKWKIAKNLCLLDCKFPITITEVCKRININRTHPYFFEIFSFLLNRGIIIHIKTIQTSKFIKINKSKLEYLLRSSEPFLEVEDFIHQTTKPFAVTG